MVRARKKPLSKKAKVDRLSFKGWAEGWRERFLNERLRAYTDALEAGHENELTFLKKLYKEYFYYCPVSVGDTEEPVLPEEPWNKTQAYAAENLTAEEMVAKRARMKVLKKRIRGYMRYRAQKLWRIRSLVRHSVLDDGFAVLLAKLSGVTKPPKAHQAFQQWWSANKESILKAAKAEYERVCNELQKQKVPPAEWPKWNVDFHSVYARNTFKAMSKEEQAEWGQMAKEEAAQAKDEYTRKMTSRPSQDPKDRAARIENMVSFLAPILEGIHDLTGLHVIVSAAGPMPHRGGEHAVISAASGLNLEPEPVPATHWQSDSMVLPGGGLQERGYGAWRDHLLAWCSTAYTPSDTAAIIPGSTPSLKPTHGEQTEPRTIDLERKILLRMDDDDDEDEDDVDGNIFDSDHESDDEEVTVPKKRGKKQGGSAPKKRAAEKDIEKENDGVEGQKEELFDHTGWRLSQYEVNRNAQIRQNKALLATIMEGTELPWQKEAREKEAADKLKKAAAREKAKSTREERARNAPLQAMRQSSRLAANPSSIGETNTSTIPAQTESPDASSQRPETTLEGDSLGNNGDDLDIEGSEPGITNGEVLGLTTLSGISQESNCEGSGGLAQGGDVEQTTDVLPTRDNGLEARESTRVREEGMEAQESTRVQEESASTRPRPTALGPVISSLSAEMRAAVGDSPDWFRLPYRHFNEAKLGREWQKLIDAFVELEARADFKVLMGSMESRKRPQLLSDWIKRGRHSKKDEVLELPLTGIATFANVYTAWWGGMQPSWRTKTDGGWAREGYGEEWGVLVARGVLGWLSVVACIFWWGNAVARGRKVKEREVWVEAVIDAEWMMHGVTAATT